MGMAERRTKRLLYCIWSWVFKSRMFSPLAHCGTKYYTCICHCSPSISHIHYTLHIWQHSSHSHHAHTSPTTTTWDSDTCFTSVSVTEQPKLLQPWSPIVWHHHIWVSREGHSFIYADGVYLFIFFVTWAYWWSWVCKTA